MNYVLSIDRELTQDEKQELKSFVESSFGISVSDISKLDWRAYAKREAQEAKQKGKPVSLRSLGINPRALGVNPSSDCSK